MNLNEGQKRAFEEIMHSLKLRRPHLLDGGAGTGKTTLCIELVQALLRLKLRVAVTAPSHKALGVLRRKLKEEANLDAPSPTWRDRKQGTCPKLAGLTIHSFAGCMLREEDGELVLYKEWEGWAQFYDVVFIDECSLMKEDIQGFVNDLNLERVLYIGDRAQLPPVGELIAQCFELVKYQSTLTKVERQALESPSLAAATIIRGEILGPRANKKFNFDILKHCLSSSGLGIVDPGDEAEDMVREAFTSDEYLEDPDSNRMIFFTNGAVHAGNAFVRNVQHGETHLPVVPGETVICHTPVVDLDNPRSMVFDQYQEAIVLAVEERLVTFSFDKLEPFDAWAERVPLWWVKLHSPGGETAECYMPLPASKQKVAYIRQKLRFEALSFVKGSASANERWRPYYEIKNIMVDLRPGHAMTVHRAQGSTFDHIFLGLEDCRIAEKKEGGVKFFRQLIYTAITRPRFTVTLIPNPKLWLPKPPPRLIVPNIPTAWPTTGFFS